MPGTPPALSHYVDLTPARVPKRRAALTATIRPPADNDLERIRRANQHLMSLVTDILNFARLDAGQIEFRLADVEFGSVVADLEPLLGPQLAAKGITFDHDACAPDTPDEPHLVRADPEKLRQILLNLLTNAVKFNKAGGRVTVHTRVDRDGSFIIAVADTGIGISADARLRIFAPFQQADPTVSRRFEGTGLGLWICKALIEMHQGSIEVESEEQMGTTVTTRWPARRIMTNVATAAD